MTKINKLGKSTFVIAILSFVLVAVLAFGGTYAYFSANASKEGSFNLGRLRVVSVDGEGTSGAFEFASTIAVPNQTIEETVTATIDSNINYYVRAIVTVEVDECTTSSGDGHNFAHSHTCTEKGDKLQGDETNLAILDITGIGGSAWTKITDNTDNLDYYYLALVDSKVPVQTKDTDEQSITVTIKVNDWVGADGCNFWMDATVTVTVEFQTLQADCLAQAPVDGYATSQDLHDDWKAYASNKRV
jgi:predicted ribosomally synthesized peptide with SipW-like signal peptide